MKKILITFILFASFCFLVPLSRAGHYPQNVIGRILLQVEENGEAWYVYPENKLRYYLGRPSDAFDVMRKLGLGAKHDLIVGTEVFPVKLSGLILLDVETHGEAYYINPLDLKKYYLGRPSDAFALMREFGLGITTNDLINVPIGDIEDEVIVDMSDKTNLSIYDELIDNNVAFVSQAPFGDWADQRQQDGCEESSALMAVHWARGEGLTNEVGLREILAASDYELEKYGEYRDISTLDTVNWLFKDYFNFQNVILHEDVTVDDIIEQLYDGNLVIVPMNGQLLNNPYFTHPGPIRHLLLIKGYDPETDEFITNEPGTRHGADFRYKKEVLFNAIRDYPTGYHEYIDKVRKNMIVVSKESQ